MAAHKDEVRMSVEEQLPVFMKAMPGTGVLPAETAETNLQARSATLPDGVEEELLECALTYYREGAGLIYGNGYTANNEHPARHPFAVADTPSAAYVSEALYPIGWVDDEDPTHDDGGEIPDEDDTEEGGDGLQGSETTVASGPRLRLQMDCSSFVWLVLSGIPYSYSRLARDSSNPNLPARTTNERYYDWGMRWPDMTSYYPTYKGAEYQYRVLAEGLCRYFDDKGWGFVPASDASNLKTGDILFFAAPDPADDNLKDYYLGVRHVAIFLWNNGYGQTIVLDCSTSDRNFHDEKYGMRPVRVRVISTPYRNRMVRAARIPLVSRTANGVMLPGRATRQERLDIPTYMNGRIIRDRTASNLLPAVFDTAMQPSTFYTVEALVRQDRNQHRQAIGIKLHDQEAIIDRALFPNWGSKDDYYTFHFFVTMDGWIINRPDGWLYPTAAGLQGLTLTGFSYYDTGDTLPSGSAYGEYISSGCLQKNTVVRKMRVFDWIRNGSREDCEREEVYEGTDSVTIPSGWDRLDVRAFLHRADSSAQDYVALFAGSDSAANKRLFYASIPANNAYMSIALTIERDQFDGLLRVSGTYSAKNSQTNLEATTAFNRLIQTDQTEGLTFKINSGAVLASDSQIIVARK